MFILIVALFRVDAIIRVLQGHPNRNVQTFSSRQKILNAHLKKYDPFATV